MRKLILKFAALWGLLECVKLTSMTVLLTALGALLAFIVFADLLLDYASPE
jgi:hypothetical protein